MTTSCGARTRSPTAWSTRSTPPAACVWRRPRPSLPSAEDGRSAAGARGGSIHPAPRGSRSLRPATAPRAVAPEAPLNPNVVVLGLIVSMSPLPILAEVLSMTESGRVRSAVSLAVGYALALGVIAVASVAIGDQASSSPSGASTTTAVIDLVARRGAGGSGGPHPPPVAP